MPPLGAPAAGGAAAAGDRAAQRAAPGGERFRSPSRLMRRLTLSRRSVNFSANELMMSDNDDSEGEDGASPARAAAAEGGPRPSGAVIGGWPTPSQRRYIQYFYTILRSPSLPQRNRAGLRLLSVVISAPPRPYAQLGGGAAADAVGSPAAAAAPASAPAQAEYVLVLLECSRRESGVTEKLVMRGQVEHGGGADAADGGDEPATPGKDRAAARRSVTFECNSVLSRDAVIAVYAAAPATGAAAGDCAGLIRSRHLRQMEAPLFSFALHTAFMDEGRVVLPIKQLDIVIGPGLSEQQKLCEFPNDFKVRGGGRSHGGRPPLPSPTRPDPRAGIAHPPRRSS